MRNSLARRSMHAYPCLSIPRPALHQKEHANGVSFPDPPLVAPVAVPVDENRQREHEGRLGYPRANVDVARQGELGERKARQYSGVDAAGPKSKRETQGKTKVNQVPPGM